MEYSSIICAIFTPRNVLEDDPRFSNSGSFKFRLQRNSPALGLVCSTMAKIAPLDFDGLPRDLVAPERARA